MVVKPLLEGEAPGDNMGRFNLKSGIDVTTRVVMEDEPCFYLGEFNLPSKSGKTRSRYQVLRVVRDDRLATAYVYLGPASAFKADQFQALGGSVADGWAWHTVGELRELADEARDLPPLAVEPDNLQEQFRDSVDERARQMRSQSTFGPKGFVQRS